MKITLRSANKVYERVRWNVSRNRRAPTLLAHRSTQRYTASRLVYLERNSLLRLNCLRPMPVARRLSRITKTAIRSRGISIVSTVQRPWTATALPDRGFEIGLSTQHQWDQVTATSLRSSKLSMPSTSMKQRSSDRSSVYCIQLDDPIM